MVLGTYKEAVAARSTDKRIQEVAQDGGIASALLIYALENNEDGMLQEIVVRPVVENNY